ncbi:MULTISPECIES: spore coat protein CotJB [unclassified Candidatus Frackibacter]|uniref:spore coat protein CotJB n=1 Tax=unclassified Candidatus Frackibacter TaxID=2648818 RepID=UPI00079C813A|nr:MULTISPECIES: spore coat protein CotJB [unclassified Candidatus Frackibacter]KXS42802.1 MAG: spore coat protein JB [Candidatus Frackibacter sp. T328-2]SDC30100.1 spore coat protein JB [Candidatus Frackibacter sp. WG11]SEM94850.1 spore coat protein JB [Candidatus Frackibacter sp. WG12]SFL57943.1 spore coat protein JB [Candidatus Frackibacter sp. WG13]
MPQEQLEMLKELMAIQFTVHELVLYLDTHPDDEEALELYDEYAMELQELMQEYQEEYGPIVARHPLREPMEDYWEYIQTAWPWQIEY